jgi:hypothetical protein
VLGGKRRDLPPVLYEKWISLHQDRLSLSSRLLEGAI